MKRSTSAGFTLIELLVVIAIIALLAGIALPVFGRVQERARATKDASGLRQIGIAMVAYFNDNNDTMFAKAPTGAASAATPTSWPDILKVGNYMPDTRIFQSPFDRRPVPAGATTYNVSYGVNANAWNETVTGLSKWTAPSRTILIAPNNKGDATLTSSWNSLSLSQPETTLPQPAPALGTYNSGQSINALYGDSHVETSKWLDYSKTAATSHLWWPKSDGSTD